MEHLGSFLAFGNDAGKSATSVPRHQSLLGLRAIAPLPRRRVAPSARRPVTRGHTSGAVLKPTAAVPAMKSSSKFEIK